jgi:hypothetical protein
VSEAFETLGRMWPLGRALGAGRLDRRGTRPAIQLSSLPLDEWPYIHTPQRDRPRSVATSTLMSGEAAASALAELPAVTELEGLDGPRWLISSLSCSPQ